MTCWMFEFTQTVLVACSSLSGKRGISLTIPILQYCFLRNGTAKCLSYRDEIAHTIHLLPCRNSHNLLLKNTKTQGRTYLLDIGICRLQPTSVIQQWVRLWFKCPVRLVSSNLCPSVKPVTILFMVLVGSSTLPGSVCCLTGSIQEPVTSTYQNKTLCSKTVWDNVYSSRQVL